MLLSMLSAALLAAPFLEPRLFPLAWLAFVPLFWAIQRAGTFRKAVFCGWFMGFVAHLIGFHWLVYTISAFGGFPYSISAIVFLLYAALQAIQMALFALLVRSVGLGPLCIFPAVFWVALEFLFPLLFPWHVANSQVSFLWFIQSADLVGPYGAGFIVVWFNAALFQALVAREQEPSVRFLPLGCSVFVIALSLVYGFQRIESVGEDMATARKLPVAAVQGNVDIDLKWDPALAQKNLDEHRRLTDGWMRLRW